MLGLCRNLLCLGLLFCSYIDALSISKVLPRSRGNMRAATKIESSLISPDDHFGLIAAISTSACVAMQSEKRTALGKSLSAPVCAMIITVLLTNIGVLPTTDVSFISAVQVWVVKLATPLLLLSADFKRIIRETGPMFNAFVIGSIGTISGSFIGCIFLRSQLSALPEGWRVVSALTAKNIGGGLNFMVVANVLSISDKTIGLGLAVDNLLGLIYFPLISWLASPYVENSSENTDKLNEFSPQLVNSETIVSALTIACVVTTLSEFLARTYRIPALPISTVISIVIATFFSETLNELIPAGDTLVCVVLIALATFENVYFVLMFICKYHAHFY